ncbi:hypothetical protein [Arcobacter porcinus]|uniref:DUF177 domain-containing protein n=1 Tax=Arcobacter porcinus TaxID=1935204 RepID=A0A5C2HJV8_9BACT|nr:hypothetical protein [Arcobacter porcinus]OCL88056.1 hypothetical protein AAX30_00663 [Arcobacter porcinus]OCL90174.1 hypothetical protein AAX27_01579 [Aliarcobacter thereius]QEP41362.1 hypothetical protein APORC_1801 [Arcobacter porcinus]
MKIEFKKVPQDKKELNTSFDSVKIEGTFCRISSTLVKIEAKLKGEITVDCSRCPNELKINLNEDLNLLISNGIFKGIEDDFLVIEVDEIIDFDSIIESEINSIKSDYYLCNSCENSTTIFEQEF